MSKRQLYMQIISPSSMLFEGVIHHVKFPGEMGSFAVYPLHAPLISSLAKGKIEFYTNQDDKHVIEIDSGFVEVKNNRITACVEE